MTVAQRIRTDGAEPARKGDVVLGEDWVSPEALAEAMWQQLSDVPGRLRLVQRFTDMHHSLLRDSARRLPLTEEQLKRIRERNAEADAQDAKDS